MKLLTIIAIISVLFAVYVVWGRPWMRKAPWAAPFFAWIEPIEIFLWRKSETLLKARAKMALGLILTALTQAGAIDITPIMPFVPDEWEPIIKFVWNLIPLTLTIGGWVDEKLRKDTTKPLEMVAIADKDITAEVAEKMAVADDAKTVAVAAVVEAEAAEV